MTAKNVAAFFDIDGTLLSAPSLEMRFVSHLLKQRELHVRAVARWLGKFLQEGLRPARHYNAISSRLRALDRNKLYLAGIRRKSLEAFADESTATLPLDEFFPDAIAQLYWHRERGHKIFLLSGTLAPLARAVARRLAHTSRITVGATELEVSREFLTGRIAGEAICGPAKARTIRRFAARHGIDLLCSYAYGNSSADRWMLAAVGHSVAVNPSTDLARLARRSGWRIAQWSPTFDAAHALSRDSFAFKGRPSER